MPDLPGRDRDENHWADDLAGVLASFLPCRSHCLASRLSDSCRATRSGCLGPFFRGDLGSLPSDGSAGCFRALRDHRLPTFDRGGLRCHCGHYLLSTRDGFP